MTNSLATFLGSLFCLFALTLAQAGSPPPPVYWMSNWNGLVGQIPTEYLDPAELRLEIIKRYASVTFYEDLLCATGLCPFPVHCTARVMSPT